MAKYFIKPLVLILCIAGFSCKKNGLGGEAEIAAFPKHHGRAIKGCTLYVKFDAKDLPNDPTNNYDLKIAGSAKEDHIHIEELRAGDYFLYATGFDSTIQAPVTGGIGVSIKWSERKEEKDVDVPVTE